MIINTILFLSSFSTEIYKHNKEERIARTWGTITPGLPYVEEAITNAGNWLIGGNLEVMSQSSTMMVWINIVSPLQNSGKNSQDAMPVQSLPSNFAAQCIMAMLCSWLTPGDVYWKWVSKTQFYCFTIGRLHKSRWMMCHLVGEWRHEKVFFLYP